MNESDGDAVPAEELLGVLADRFHTSDVTFAFGWLTLMGHVQVDAENETVQLGQAA